VDAFDGDHSGDLRPRQTPGVLYSKARPTPVSNPRLLAWSEDLARELGLEPPDADDVNVLAGNLVAPTMQPYAACYAGHQFGNWAGQLGDGRAITLGELTAPGGQTWELQLKGAGPTPYSRRADGRAVLRSSLREYLLSEAMHSLGVPTTRALGLVATGDEVLRDMFYNGNPAYEPGAIVMRVAPSFLRFGNYEMPAARQETENLRKLVDWTIDRYYPHLAGEDRVLRWFAEVVERTAHLMTEWMRVGFVHGVMNTDNMSILGLTIDYGPFSFVDDYDPKFTPNTTDLPGRRYAFAKQPSVGYWNLGCLASAIAPLVPDRNGLMAVVKGYEEIYWRRYYRMMADKLGLDEVRPADVELVAGLEQTLASLKPDMTIFYQLLTEGAAGLDHEEEVVNHFRAALYREPMRNQREALQAFIKSYGERLAANAISREASRERMQRANPRFIPRNYLLHQAIEEIANGSDALFRKLQQAIKTPYARDYDEFFVRRPDWAGRKAGCSMLSCSS
jgi:uncharacterized protein YdiU (UPF0061 family)